MSDAITAKFEGLDDFRALLHPDQYKKAATSAVNKLADQGRAEASRSIREQYNLKVADVNKKFTMKRSRDADLRAVIEAAGKPIPLIYFNANQLTAQNRLITRTMGKQLKRASTRAQGVTIQITKGQTITLPHAFIATMANGHIGVFTRANHPAKSQYDNSKRRTTNRPYVKVNRTQSPKMRQAIVEKAFVTIPTVFGGRTTMPRVKQMISDKWPAVMRHEMDYFLSKGR